MVTILEYSLLECSHPDENGDNSNLHRNCVHGVQDVDFLEPQQLYNSLSVNLHANNLLHLLLLRTVAALNIVPR
jgi:hypothetical protein